MIRVDDFKSVFPKCKDADEWVNAMNIVLPTYGLNKPLRIVGFVSQCGHESAGWTRFTENLNYSAGGLNAVFSKYFRNRDANQYARQPEKIANLVYANRMGNGSIDSGDGWKYRGRGPIQLTGYDNYELFSNASGIDAVENPDIVVDNKIVGVKAAVWFWDRANLNKFADVADIRSLTRGINGGYNGLKHRVELFNRYLIKAYRKDEVIEQYLGKCSSVAVREFQEKAGLSVDGIVGVNTLKKLLIL